MLSELTEYFKSWVLLMLLLLSYKDVLTWCDAIEGNMSFIFIRQTMNGDFWLTLLMFRQTKCQMS